MEQQQPQASFHNPQEPPASQQNDSGHYSNNSSNNNNKQKNKRLPICIFDLYLDLPHPAASTRDNAKIIDPPVTFSPPLAKEMHNVQSG